MADPFVAEIRTFGFNFAPNGWAQCDGQIIPLSQNTALFSLLGTNFGGDGRSTFALPNLQGRAPISWGQGAGLTPRDLGESGGAASVTLLQSEMPQHTHVLPVQSGAPGRADRGNAAGNYLAAPADATYANGAAGTPMSANSVSTVGNNQPHNNLQPYLTLNFCIALQGVFPPRQ